MLKHRWLTAVVVLTIVAGWYVLCQPVVVARDEGGVVLATADATPSLRLTARFVHSAQKTPVIEAYAVNESRNGLTLIATRYQSQGFGLPFMESDGQLTRDGDWLVVTLRREIGTLRLRPGVINEYTLNVGGHELRLCELVPLGSLVTVSVEPRYQQYLRE